MNIAIHTLVDKPTNKSLNNQSASFKQTSFDEKKYVDLMLNEFKKSLINVSQGIYKLCDNSPGDYANIIREKVRKTEMLFMNKNAKDIGLRTMEIIMRSLNDIKKILSNSARNAIDL